MYRRWKSLLVLALIISLLACGRGSTSSLPTRTPIPTFTATTVAELPRPTATTEPTATLPASTATPVPTATAPPLPTDTPLPPPPDTPLPPEPPAESAPSQDAPGQNLVSAQVINVVDGDTIDVLIDGVEYRLRYILVDTPETKHPTKGVQPFGPEASEANRQMVEGQTVYLEKDVSDTDRYGRLLRYVYLADGRMVNEELLRMGLAQVATFPPDVKYVDRFLAVQREAQANGVGLWSGEPVVEQPAPTATPDVPPPDPAATGENGVVIVDVNKGDEYVDLYNASDAPVDLTGWRLLSEKGNQDCALGGVIGPGETLRVWAVADDAGRGGYNCGFGSNIWNNSERDPAVLFNAAGLEVSRME